MIYNVETMSLEGREGVMYYQSLMCNNVHQCTINTLPVVFCSRLSTDVKRGYSRRTSENSARRYSNEPASYCTGVQSFHEFSLSTHARRQYSIENRIQQVENGCNETRAKIFQSSVLTPPSVYTVRGVST